MAVERMPVTAGIVIPALQEEASIGRVIAGLNEVIRATGCVRLSAVVVADNGSTDRTAAVASDAGAVVVSEPRRGYGYACKKGLAWFAENAPIPDIIIFADGDLADDPRDLPELVRPITEEGADLVIGSRQPVAAGALTLPQRIGNRLACFLIRVLYGERFTDLGPFRTIRWNALAAIGMQDDTYGWTVEMQLKAAKMRMRCAEVRVRYHPRVGVSKVSGTLKGAVMAGYKILHTIFRYR